MESHLSLSTFVRYNKDALNLSMEKLSCVSKGIEEVDICPSVLNALLSSSSSQQHVGVNERGKKNRTSGDGNIQSSSSPALAWEGGVPIEIQLAAQNYIAAQKQSKQNGSDAPSRSSSSSSGGGGGGGESGFNIAIAFSLHTIHLSRNCLSTTLGLLQFRNVVRLSLLGNRIRKLEDCLPLSLLPSLQYLSMEFNPVCHVPNYRAHMLQMMSTLLDVPLRGSTDPSRNGHAPVLRPNRSPSRGLGVRPASMMLDCRLKLLDGKAVTREELHDAILVLQRESSLLPEIHKRLRLVQFLKHVDCTLELHEEMRSKGLLRVTTATTKGTAKHAPLGVTCTLLERCADSALYHMVDASESKHLARLCVQAHCPAKTCMSESRKGIERRREIRSLQRWGREHRSPSPATGGGNSPTMVEMYLSHISDATSPSSSGIVSHEGSSTSVTRETNLLEDLSDLLLHSEFSWSKNIIMSSEETEEAAPKTSGALSKTTGALAGRVRTSRGGVSRHETAHAQYVANPCPAWSRQNFRSCVAHLEVHICLHFLRIARQLRQGISSSEIDAFMLWWQQRPLLYLFSETAFCAKEQINVTGKRNPFYGAIQAQSRGRSQQVSPHKFTAAAGKPPIAPISDNLPLRHGGGGGETVSAAAQPNIADLAGRKEVVVYVDDAEEEQPEEASLGDRESTASSLSTISSPTAKSLATPPREAAVPSQDTSSDRTPSYLSSLLESNKSALMELLHKEEEQGEKEETQQQAAYVLKIQQEDVENQLVEALQKRLATAQKRRLWQQWQRHLSHVEMGRQSVWYSKARLYTQKSPRGKQSVATEGDDRAIFAKAWSRSLAYSLDALPQTERKRFFFEHWQRRARQQQQAHSFQLRQRFSQRVHRAEDASVSRQLDLSVHQSILADTFHKWKAKSNSSYRSISSSTMYLDGSTTDAAASTTVSDAEQEKESALGTKDQKTARQGAPQSPNTPEAKPRPEEARGVGDDLFAALNGLTSRRSTPTVVWGRSSRASVPRARDGCSPVSVKLSSPPPPFLVSSTVSTPSYTARSSGAVRFSPSPDAGAKGAHEDDAHKSSCIFSSNKQAHSPLATPPAVPRPATVKAIPAPPPPSEKEEETKSAVMCGGAYPDEDVEQLVRVAAFYKKDHQRLSCAIRQAKSEDARHMMQPSVLNDLLMSLTKTTRVDGSGVASPEALRSEREWYGQSTCIDSQ